MTQPMHFWTGFGGVRLAGDAWGNPAGPLVLLQHGGGQTRHSWKRAGETLGAAGYHAVAFDARGHGDSDWAPDGLYSEEAMVADLKCVVKALGGRRQPVLVGASMGGQTSLLAIGAKHIEAAALILLDVAPRLETEGVNKIQAFMSQKQDGFDSLVEIADAISRYQPHRRRPKDLTGLRKNVRRTPDGKYRWHWDPRFMSMTLDLERRQEQLSACARRLTLPTLLVRGGLSDILSEEGVADFLQMCPHSEYINIPDAAHMIAGDRSDIFTETIMEFLSRTVPAGGESVALQPAAACPPPVLPSRNLGHSS